VSSQASPGACLVAMKTFTFPNDHLTCIPNKGM
jgi:hypothetical protein